MALDVWSLENKDYHRTKTCIISKYLVYIISTLTSFIAIASYYISSLIIFFDT